LGLFKQNLKQQKRKFEENSDFESDQNNSDKITHENSQNSNSNSNSNSNNEEEKEREKEKDGNWYTGKLKFTKHQDDAYRNKV